MIYYIIVMIGLGIASTTITKVLGEALGLSDRELIALLLSLYVYGVAIILGSARSK